MAQAASAGYVASAGVDLGTAATQHLFWVEQVGLQFEVAADFVAAQVADNALILALATGRLLRIDLLKAEDVDGSMPLAKSHCS